MTRDGRDLSNNSWTKRPKSKGEADVQRDSPHMVLRKERDQGRRKASKDLRRTMPKMRDLCGGLVGSGGVQVVNNAISVPHL